MINKMKNMMAEIFKRSVIFSVAATLVVSGLMLCCQVGLVYAGQKILKSNSCCQSSTADQIKEQKAKTCHCCMFSKETSDQVKESFVIAKSPHKIFYNSFLSVVQVFKNARQDSLLVLAGQDPPRHKSSIPIYLQVCNLRL